MASAKQSVVSGNFAAKSAGRLLAKGTLRGRFTRNDRTKGSELDYRSLRRTLNNTSTSLCEL
jgi:hypothetical protein